MLPFALVVYLHYMTPFVSSLISYTFISLDTRADELDEEERADHQEDDHEAPRLAALRLLEASVLRRLRCVR